MRPSTKSCQPLYNTFSDNVLHDEENYVTYLNDDQLDGLSDGFIKSAAAIATEKGKEGRFAITNTRSSMDPFPHLFYKQSFKKTGLDQLLLAWRQWR